MSQPWLEMSSGRGFASMVIHRSCTLSREPDQQRNGHAEPTSERSGRWMGPANRSQI